MFDELKEANTKYFISITNEDAKHFVCVGFVGDYITAQRVVQCNTASILNNAKYAVIEKVREGIFMYDTHPVFYKVTKKKDGDYKATRLKIIPSKLLNREGKMGFGININK